jgi:hypothetical protein
MRFMVPMRAHFRGSGLPMNLPMNLRRGFCDLGCFSLQDESILIGQFFQYPLFGLRHPRFIGFEPHFHLIEAVDLKTVSQAANRATAS